VRGRDAHTAQGHSPTKEQLKGRKAKGGPLGQFRPGRVIYTLSSLRGGLREFPEGHFSCYLLSKVLDKGSAGCLGPSCWYP
jgi:hypothetical protein